MKTNQKLVLGLLVGAAVTGLAAVSDQQAGQLGQDLTPVGAQKAGNQDGTIPAWTGGEMQPASDWKVGDNRADANPYKDEKPLFSIDASNVDQYQDKLSVGQIALIETYQGYRMDVYPTHRSCGFPDFVYKRTRQNATLAKLADNGYHLAEALGAGFPFPIPQNGAEAIWNHKLRWQGEGRIEYSMTYSPSPGGSKPPTRLDAVYYYAFPFQSPENQGIDDANGVEFLVQHRALEPAIRLGEVTLGKVYLNRPTEVWWYFPRQRRVRRTPTYQYDNPVRYFEDIYMVDQFWMFHGQLDRYDFKLVGKKELYVPYNTFQLQDSTLKADDVFGPNYPNRDIYRYELHRVWVVEATIKLDRRHLMPKRVFYLDEDTWQILVMDGYDSGGKIWRLQEGSLFPVAELGTCGSQEVVGYDLSNRRYFADVWTLGHKTTDWLAGQEGRVRADMFAPEHLQAAASE